MNPDMLISIDETVFRYVHSGCRSAIADPVMMFASGSTDGLLVFIAALCLMVLPRKRNKAAGLILLAGLEVSYQLTRALKHVVARPRPFEALSGISPMIHAQGFSMPSNHAATAFALAFILSRYYGKAPLFYAIAALIAISRVYVGVHFPGDVIAGSLLGIMIGYVLVSVADKAGLSRQ